MKTKGKDKAVDVFPPNLDSMTQRDKAVLEEALYKKQMYSRTYGR